MQNKDKFDVFQKRVVGIAVSTGVVYFYLLDKLKDGLGLLFPYVQQAVALCMVVLVIISGWKFVEVLFKARTETSQKLIDLLNKKKEIEEEDK